MTSTSHARSLPRVLAWFAALLVASLPLAAIADPPGRALRLSYITGAASFAPAGSDDWVVARVNRPLWIGDRVWSASGYVELQIGGASVRLAPRTSLTVLNFDDRLAQFEVTEGSVALHVRAIDEREQAIEVDTPALAFVVRTEGAYRVDVEHDRTAVGVRRGWAEVWGAGHAFRIDRPEQYVFYNADLRDYDVYAWPAADAFQRWASERASRENRAASARYVSPELVGYVDLDYHGDWRAEPNLGNIWYPRVDANWAPYRYGHWSWIDPWGWTWVDDASWGFAPFHYGRWTQLHGRWGWVPGPRDVRPVYAPALVAWVGGANFSLSVSSGPAQSIAWFPLAPGEIWRPSYDVSRDYFTRVNVSNTFVNQTTIVNFYDDARAGRPMRDHYRYRVAPQAVTVVPVETFVQSRPVQRNVLRVDAQAFARTSVAAAPDTRPVLQSFVGGSARSQARPPEETMRRTVVARQAPPAAVPSLQDKVNLVRERGRPIDRQELDQGRPAGTAPAQAPSARARAETAPRSAPRELRAGVRVLDAGNDRPTSIPPKLPEGVAATPRGPVPDFAPAAPQADRAAARPRANASGDRGVAPPRSAAAERDAESSRREPAAPHVAPQARDHAEPSRAAPARNGGEYRGRPETERRATPANPPPATAPVQSASPPAATPQRTATPPAKARPPQAAGESAGRAMPPADEAAAERGAPPSRAKPSSRDADATPSSPPAQREDAQATDRAAGESRRAPRASESNGKGRDDDDEDRRRGKGER